MRPSKELAAWPTCGWNNKWTCRRSKSCWCPTTLCYAFSVGGLNRDVQTLLKGRSVGQVYEKQDRVFEVVVRAFSESPFESA